MKATETPPPIPLWKRRQGRLGASDIAVILGLSEYKTAAELQREKLGMLVADQGSAATKLGNHFERAVLDYFAIDRGVELEGFGLEARWRGTPITVILDAMIVGTRRPVDAKTGGLTGWLGHQWGPDGSDEVPLAYIVQLQTQMAALGGDVGYIAALLGGRGFAWFEIPRDEELIEIIGKTANEWWQRHVTEQQPCVDESRMDIEVFKRIRRVPKKVVTINSETHAAFQAAQEARKAAEKTEEDARRALMLELHDAEAGEVDGVENWYTYFESKRRGYTVEPTTARTLRFTKRKANS